MTNNKNQKLLLEWKKQLTKLPDTDTFRQQREKIEIKITSSEIMSTPAAGDFVNDILAKTKKLLLPKSPANWAEILTREQFYRNNRLPTEINDLIEKQVWNLTVRDSRVGEDVSSFTFKNFVFIFNKWNTSRDYTVISLPFKEPVQLIEGIFNGMTFPFEKAKNFESFLKHQNALLLKTPDGVNNKIELLSFLPAETKIGLHTVEISKNENDLLNLVIPKNENDLFFLDFKNKICPNVDYFFELKEYQGEPWKPQQELVKEVCWLLRLLRNDISLAETAPKGLKKTQEFLQNHFQREFVKLHQDNPQLLARVKDLPWFKFTALQANIPQPIAEEQTLKTPSLKPEESLEQLKEVEKQILERINAQAEQAKNKPIYSLPFSPKISPEKKEFQPAKICKILDCQISVAPPEKLCSFHKWETGFDQRFNAERTNLFPNLPRKEKEPTTNQKKKENITDKSDENDETRENQAEQERISREEQLRLEKESREKKQPKPEQPNPNQNSNEQPNGNNQPQPDNNDSNGQGPKGPNHQSFFAQHPYWKKTALSSGVGLVSSAAFAIIATGVGYASIHGLAALGAAKSATGFATIIKAGLSAQAITSQALAGLSLKSYFSAGLFKIGGSLSGVVQGLGTFLISSPWIWVPALLLGVAGLGYLIYKKFDLIKSFFTTSQKVDEVASKISEPLSHTLRPYLMDETSEENNFYQAQQQATQYQTHIDQLQEQLAEQQIKINQLEAKNQWEKDNCSDYSETEFARLREDLTEQQQNLTEQLNQVQEQLRATQAQINNTPAAVRQSSQAKNEQVKKTVHRGVKYTLYFLIVLVLLLIWKTIRWIFSKIFGWVRTTNDQTIEKIKKQVEAMAQELQAEQIHQEAQRIKQAREQLKNQAEKQPTPEEIITPPATKNEPLVIKLEQPSVVVKNKTTEQKKHDRINAQRRARYRLKKKQAQQKAQATTPTKTKKSEPSQ